MKEQRQFVGSENSIKGTLYLQQTGLISVSSMNTGKNPNVQLKKASERQAETESGTI